MNNYKSKRLSHILSQNHPELCEPWMNKRMNSTKFVIREVNKMYDKTSKACKDEALRSIICSINCHLK